MAWQIPVMLREWDMLGARFVIGVAVGVGVCG